MMSTPPSGPAGDNSVRYPCTWRISSTSLDRSWPLKRCPMNVRIWSWAKAAKSTVSLASSSIEVSAGDSGVHETDFPSAIARIRSSAWLRRIWHTVMNAPSEYSRSWSNAVRGMSSRIHSTGRT